MSRKKKQGVNKSKPSNCRICLNMIVKNESHIIHEALDSLLPHIHAWVICDTGSTDGTQDFVKTYFSSRNIPGELHQHDWINFGENRTKAMEITYGVANTKYNCDFILVFDADDVLKGVPIFPTKQNVFCDGYYMNFRDGFEYSRLVLMNAKSKWIYRGVLHEFPECMSTHQPKEGSIMGEYYILSRRLGARSKDKLKYLKDAQLLENALETEQDAFMRRRYIFYAAQSYVDAGDYENAIKYYKQRLDLEGWSEEIFMSAIHLMNLYISQGCSFAELHEFFMRAFIANPNRPEPWHIMARYLRQKEQWREAYAYAKVAQRAPPPSPDMLFVNYTIYDYEADDEVAIAAYYIGKTDECEELCKKILLRTDIDDITRRRVEENLGFCNPVSKN